MTKEIEKVETQIMELTQKLVNLRKDVAPVKVKNYSFATITGKVSLLELALILHQNCRSYLLILAFKILLH